MTQKHITFDACCPFILDICKLLNIDVHFPRMARKSLEKLSISANVKDYFRCNVFIPFMDLTISQLEIRFSSHLQAASRLMYVIPSKCVHASKFSCEQVLVKFYIFRLFTFILGIGQMQPAIDLYKSDLIDYNSFSDEFLLWKARWQRANENERPKTAADTLPKCDSEFFPNVRRLIEVVNLHIYICTALYSILNYVFHSFFVFIQILSVLPVSNASAERSFSCLRRLKTYLRSCMLEDRLNGLALMNVYPELIPTPESVIDKFARMKNRNLDLIL